ncbi:MAG: tripartite tricarboxylate transporter permease [Peptococcaceae bacterium]
MNLDLMINGLIVCFNITNMLLIVVGTFVGIIVGALPGLTATMATAVLVPITFGMQPISALVLLGAAYCGAIYGGSISAILLNTPGTPSAAATCIEGYPMAQKGEGGQALGMAAIASFIGGIISAAALVLFAPPLAKLALGFGPSEYFLLAVFGLTVIISLSMNSFLKGIIAGIIGLLLGTVGMDPLIGFKRYTFGFINLMSGLPMIPTLVGLLSTSQLFILAEKSGTKILQTEVFSDKILPKLSELKRLSKTLIRSSIIGIIVGAVPGAGGNISTFMAYDDAKRISRHPHKFGTGIVDGIAATESSNNAVTGGSLVTMLTLGLPGSNTTAVLLGGLMLHGLRPGPSFFVESSNVAYAFMMSLFIANVVMLLMGLLGAKYFIHIVKCPNDILIAVIMLLSVVGSFSISNSIFDVYVMFIMGVAGYILRKIGISPVPLVLAFILGPIAENGLQRSLYMSDGSIIIFFTRPICIILIILTIISVMLPILRERRAKKNIALKG